MVQGKVVDLVGQRFGRLLVLRRGHTETYGGACWECACDCGGAAVVGTSNLRTTKSCGCVRASRGLRTCSVEGCDRRHRSQGLCSRHYAQHFAQTREPPPELTLARLKEVASYDPEQGAFVRIGGARSDLIGLVADVAAADGYPRITIDGRRYGCHVLAWFYVYGVWPPDEIDHRDGDRSNYRIKNLREATRLLNAQNLRRPTKRNTSGYLGVSRHKGGWGARISLPCGKYKWLGAFSTPERAYQAYVEAKRVYHEGNTL